MSVLPGAGKLRIVDETGSTNADLLARIAEFDSPANGEWLIADRQTAGRGRQARSWMDGRGNFMGSTAIRILTGDPPPASLSLVAGMALYETVAPLVPATAGMMLKWPNDIMVGDAKLAGVLLERTADWIVVGMGVNLAFAPPVEGRSTISLSTFGPAPDRDLFAANLAHHLNEEVGRWRNYGLEPLIRRWLAAAHPLGTSLTVQAAGEPTLRGRFAGLAEDGSLRLQATDGTTRTISAGDIMLA